MKVDPLEDESIRNGSGLRGATFAGKIGVSVHVT
jgi:hypothetical protein